MMKPWKMWKNTGRNIWELTPQREIKIDKRETLYTEKERISRNFVYSVSFCVKSVYRNPAGDTIRILNR